MLETHSVEITAECYVTKSMLKRKLVCFGGNSNYFIACEFSLSHNDVRNSNSIDRKKQNSKQYT